MSWLHRPGLPRLRRCWASWLSGSAFGWWYWLTPDRTHLPGEPGGHDHGHGHGTDPESGRAPDSGARPDPDPARRRAWLVVAGALVAVLCAGATAPVALASLSTGGSVARDTEAERAVRRAAELGVPLPDMYFAVTAAQPQAAGQGARAVAAALARTSGVRSVLPGTTGAAEAAGAPGTRGAGSASDAEDTWTRSRDGRTYLVQAVLTGDAKDKKEAAPRLLRAARAAAPGLRVEAAGEPWTSREIDEATARSLARAELVGAPLVFTVLVFAYGSAVAALLPVAVAVIAILCSFPVLGLLARLTDVSSFAVNAASAIGFGLAVDYTLFLLARVKEQTSRGDTLDEALRAARRSSGRSVVFSAAAVTGALASALLVPVPLLRALSLAGMTVTLLAALAALTVLPVCVRLLGPWTDRADPLRRWRVARPGDRSRFWERTCRAVTARPVLAGGLSALVLLLLALPFAQVRLGQVDERTLPADSPAARTARMLRTDFDAPPERVLTVVVSGTDARPERLAGYQERLTGIRDVRAVKVLRPPTADGEAVLAAALDVAPDSDRAAEAVRAVRVAPASGVVRTSPAPTAVRVTPVPTAAQVTPASTAARVTPTPTAVQATPALTAAQVPPVPTAAQVTPAPGTAQVLPVPGTAQVGGWAADLVDTRDVVHARLPWCLLALAVTLALLLGVFTRSVIAPLKALAVAVISLGAAVGCLVVVFQQGHGRALLGGFTVTGALDTSLLLFTLFVALALSVDYEVFLLGRIREEYDRHGDNRRSVVDGVARTGRLLSSAAAAVAISTLVMASSSVTVLKQVGVGIAVAAVVDAVLVRGVLVPAIMTMLGPVNWWTPGSSLRRRAERAPVGDEERAPVEVADGADGPEVVNVADAAKQSEAG